MIFSYIDTQLKVITIYMFLISIPFIRYQNDAMFLRILVEVGIIQRKLYVPHTFVSENH